MAKKKEENEELIVDVQEVYSRTEQFVEDNKNVLVTIVAALAVVIGGYFAYTNFYLEPLQEEAKQEMFMAEKYFAADSLQKAIYGDGLYPGFIRIADDYGSTVAGNLANYYLGLSFLKSGQYTEAIEALKQFDSDDEVLNSMSLGAIGDAYMELGDLNRAVDNYEKAAEADNDFTAPLHLMKAANTYELLNAYEDAVKAYKRIKEDYRKSPEASSVDQYITRAETFVQ